MILGFSFITVCVCNYLDPLTPSSVRTRNTLHEVGADLTRDDPILRTSSGLERQRELVNHNLTSHISHNFHNILFSQYFLIYLIISIIKKTSKKHRKIL